MTGRERRVFLGAVAIFAVSSAANAAAFFYGNTVPTPIPGGSFTEGFVGQPVAINPVIAAGEADRDLAALLFANLPDLVESEKVSDDRTVWSLTLKPDLRWSDGERLTADDVLFTVQTIQDPESRSPQTSAWQGVKAERLSEREIRFTLRAPYAFFEDTLRTLSPIPEHRFGSIPPANLRLSTYNLEPVGSGPYAFRAFDKRKDGFLVRYELIPNPYAPAERPLVSRFAVRFYPSYRDAIAAMNRREIDALSGIPPESAAEIKVAHELAELAMPRYYAVFMNQSTHPGLKDRSVREALSLAVDRLALIRETLSGKAAPVMGPIYPAPRAEGAAAAPSLERANELLDTAGWRKTPDGIRAKIIDRAPVELALKLTVPDVPFLVRAAELLRDQWTALGVTVTILAQDPAQLAEDAIRTRNYELILFGNILKGNPDVYSFWHSSERFFPGANLALYSSKKADELLEAIRRDPDAVSRNEKAAALDELIQSDAPAIFLFSPRYLYALPKDLGGFREEAIVTPADRFSRVGAWYLKTARTFK